jgi:hypothetical protein
MPEFRLPPSNEYERTVLRNVEQFGWHCTCISPSEGDKDTSRFSYTVGLYETFGASELIIFGLEDNTAHSIFNNYAKKLVDGKPFPLNEPTSDLIENYPCVFLPVPRLRYNDFVYSALWFYAEVGFPLHQVVWPNVQGQFPWHPSATQSFRSVQPILSEPQ